MNESRPCTTGPRYPEIRLARAPRAGAPARWAGPILAVLCVLLAQGCSLFLGKSVEEEPRVPPWLSGEARGDDIEKRVALEARRLQALARGRDLYRDACATCHGLRGDGKGPSAGPLRPKPQDFTRGWSIMGSNLDIFLSISEGVPGSTMPMWRDLLSQEDRWSLVEYVKSFKKQGGERAGEKKSPID